MLPENIAQQKLTNLSKACKNYIFQKIPKIKLISLTNLLNIPKRLITTKENLNAIIKNYTN